MEEQIEKFGSGRKQKRQNNKKERGHIKNFLKNYEMFEQQLYYSLFRRIEDVDVI